jgi:hypothetical protein
MKSPLVSVFVASLLVCGSAQAQAVKTIKEAGSGSLKGDPDRVICREKTITGSRLAKSKACRTAREWNEISEANVAAAKQMSRAGGLDAQTVTGSARGTPTSTVPR